MFTHISDNRGNRQTVSPIAWHSYPNRGHLHADLSKMSYNLSNRRANRSRGMLLPLRHGWRCWLETSHTTARRPKITGTIMRGEDLTASFANSSLGQLVLIKREEQTENERVIRLCGKYTRNQRVLYPPYGALHKSCTKAQLRTARHQRFSLYPDWFLATVHPSLPLVFTYWK
jgi:hypothetical protein